MTEPSREWSDLLFGIRRSIRYHQRRRSFFDTLDNVSKMLSVIMGSATIYGILHTNAQTLALVMAALVTFLSGVNLVLGSSQRARVHAEFVRRFIAIELEMVKTAEPSALLLAQFTAQRLTIEAEEPPILRVLDCVCHNDQMRAEGYSKDQLAKIRWWQRGLAHVIDVREDLIHS